MNVIDNEMDYAFGYDYAFDYMIDHVIDHTFDNLFDESYDKELDYLKRIAILLENVKNYNCVPYDNFTLGKLEYNRKNAQNRTLEDREKSNIASKEAKKRKENI